MDKKRDNVICPFCGKTVSNNETYYTTDIACIQQVAKKKLPYETIPIFPVCADCVSERYIRESLKYKSNLPYILSTDDIKDRVGSEKSGRKK